MEAEQVEHLIYCAQLAPSSHNTQPWLFKHTAGALELYADRRRALRVNDPWDRELTISCGCALMNLRVAAGQEGFSVLVEQFPEGLEADLLARIELREHGPAAAEARLFSALSHRRTTRKSMGPAMISKPLQDALESAAYFEHAQLHRIDASNSRERVASLVAEGDRRQWARPEWRAELAAWLRPVRSGEGLRTPPFVGAVMRGMVRRFNLGRSVAGTDKQLALEAPFLGLITTPMDTQQDWLIAGQALERVLLEAAGEGFEAGYQNQPIQEAALRDELAGAVGVAGVPQILIRIGRPVADSPPSHRRPVKAVLL